MEYFNQDIFIIYNTKLTKFENVSKWTLGIKFLRYFFVQIVLGSFWKPYFTYTLLTANYFLLFGLFLYSLLIFYIYLLPFILYTFICFNKSLYLTCFRLFGNKSFAFITKLIWLIFWHLSSFFGIAKTIFFLRGKIFFSFCAII